jgi:hypothetical protein
MNQSQERLSKQQVHLSQQQKPGQRPITQTTKVLGGTSFNQYSEQHRGSTENIHQPGSRNLSNNQRNTAST